MAQIEIKCVMDSEFCKGNTWYQIRDMSDHVVYVYLDKYEFVGLPKCHFDMDNIRELKENKIQNTIEIKIGDVVVGQLGREYKVHHIKKGCDIYEDCNGTPSLHISRVTLINGEPVNGREVVYKGNKMQEKITLKVGDIFESESYRGGKNHIITSFSENKINTANGSYWGYPLVSEKYYVNGKLYARENIIVPDFKEEEKVEYQEITKDNIEAVLKHTGYERGYKIWTDRTGITLGFKDNSYTQVTFKNPNWLQIIEAHIGTKLEPLPKANPFDVVKVGQWARNINNNTWYERLAGNNINYRHGYNYCYCISTTPENWDLTDIRDYNPTECVLKVGDVVKIAGSKYTVNSFEHEKETIRADGFTSSIPFKEISRITEVNSKAYDKITIPPFDFAKCLVDAGFARAETSGGLYAIGSSWGEAKIWLNKVHFQWFLNSSTNSIEPTPANAKIIIEMANLAKGIK